MRAWNAVAAGLFFIFTLYNLCFAQAPTVSQIERTQELTEKEEAVRNKLEEEEKVLIKKIIVHGATSLSKDQIREIVLPFQNHWLSKKDIQVIISLLKAAYNQKGYNNQPAKISFEIKKHSLKIQIEEN